MKITKTLGKNNFDKLFFDKKIPDQFSLNGKDINTRFWLDDCRFLFVENDQDGLVYCYAQPDISKPAVLITKATEEKALNIFKGSQKFVASINMTDKQSQQLKETLFEVQNQPDYMKSITATTKKVNAQQNIVSNNMGGKNMNNEILELKKEKEELLADRENLVGKLAGMKAKLEDEQEFVSLLQGEHNKEIEDLLQLASDYVDQRDEYVRDLSEVYQNYVALGADYETLEKEKVALEKETKVLNKELAGLSKEFARMKNANSRNSICFAHALDEIDSLNKIIAEQNQFMIEVGKAWDAQIVRSRAERKANSQNSQNFAEKQNDAYRKNILKVLKEKNDMEKRYKNLVAMSLEGFDDLMQSYKALENKKNEDAQQLLDVLEAYMNLEKENAVLQTENVTAKEIMFRKAEEIVADTNANKEKMYELTAKDSQKNKEKRVYLAVGPHWEKANRAQGKTGRDFNTLYVITNGDPSGVTDKNNIVLNLDKILTDDKLREEYGIFAVKQIVADKNGNAQVKYYDTKTKKKLVQKTDDGLKWFSDKEVLSANYIVEVKDVDSTDLRNWVINNYDKTAGDKVKVVSPTLKARKALKISAVAATAVVLAGGVTFAGFKGWGGPNEYELAKQTGRKQVEAFVDGLDKQQGETLFQYTPAVDENGNVINYVKVVDGQELAIAGNKVVAIGSANDIFYEKSDNKLTINAHKQQNFWGKLKNYEEETIEGAAYQLGAEVVAELCQNNVPVYTFANSSNEKTPLYVYLNYASKNSDYSSRSKMVEYLTSNGYSDELAEKITKAYEEGFSSGLENGLSNKVNEIIGSNDAITPEEPEVSFSEVTTKQVIANKVASATLHGKNYSADELHVVYSDLDADGQQVVFVVANKDGATGVNANKYLYKLVLGEGETEITAKNVNDAISNAQDITESIKLDYLFKDQSFSSAVSKFNSKSASGSVAYVSNYALGQTIDGYSVAPTLTIYNSETDTIEEKDAEYVVSVLAGKNSSIIEMCALALLSDYGYYDQKGIYSMSPVQTVVTTYSDNDRELN